MLFVATCIDKPGALPIRIENRPAHLAYLGALGPKLKVAGALLSPDGQSPIGSMLIFEAETRADVDLYVAGDPFAKAGLFASIDVKPWRQGVGQPL
jgi:uncharacterized protein YciI